MGGRDSAAAKHRRRRLLNSGVLALCALAAPPSPAQPPVVQATQITEITIERDCGTCPVGSLLVLRRDGSAAYTSTGKARLGTPSRAFRGTVRAQDFEQLARTVLAQRFFDLQDSYGDPQIQDGSWLTIGVAHDGQEKKVFSRDGAGPDTLKAVETAIEALRAQTRFVPERP